VEGYNFKYSDCSGKKKALIIGINYTGTKYQLKGCINDAHNVKKFLLRNGYSQENMVILTDTDPNPRSVPTRKNMLDAMCWLVKDASPNDSLFFHYSGHGSQVKDIDGDEDDGFDETIIPLDFEENGQILDDEMHELIVRTLPEGCRLTALFDCCHSGSALDLPYTYSTKGLIKEPNLVQEASEGLLEVVQSFLKSDHESFIQTVLDKFQSIMNRKVKDIAREKTRKTRTSPADVIMLSGCKDEQKSSDAKIEGKSTGAMSYAFMKVMNSGKQQSYLSLLRNIREILSGRYKKRPQLSSSHPIDVSLKF
ncbi:caspase family protein, partial [Ascoidea rubescens DSM 1968]